MRRTPLAFVVVALLVPSATTGASVGGGLAAPRILYSSDWSGTGQIYAVDPFGRRAIGQLTFAPAPACLPGSPCGYREPIPSPDGKRLLFWDYKEQGAVHTSLFIANADGRSRRQLGTGHWLFGRAAWAPDSVRIAYSGTDGIYVVRADGSGRRRVHRHRTEYREPLAWSADGRFLAFRRGRLLVVLRGEAPSRVARRLENVTAFSWSPEGDRLAYVECDKSLGTGDVYVIRTDGSGRRRLSHATSCAASVAWSPAGRWIAVSSQRHTGILSVAGGAPRTVGETDAYRDPAFAWSPDGKQLAFDDVARGITLADAGTGATRVLTKGHGSGLSWSPDGHLLAYIGARGITTVTRAGRARTVIDVAGDHGGLISGISWTRPAARVRYRPATSRSLGIVTAGALDAPWRIERLASDGGRVAYTACGHVFVWTPAAAKVVQAESTMSLSPACPSSSYYTSYQLYTLALAGDRVGAGGVQGGIGRTWWVGGTRLGSRPEAFELGKGYSTNGPAYGDVAGELAGSGDLLVFSSWSEEFGPEPATAVTTAQQVRRALPTGCPCPTIASTPGPLVPFDVEGGRVVAGGDNETWLLDAAGRRLLTIPFSPVAAQLSERHLVLVRRGELRHYDTATGALIHTWPFPDVSTGRECASPNPHRCYRAQARLVLQDMARGLVSYVLEGAVHVLRLADGADAVLAPGATARFINTGLVYAQGSQLRWVPFDRLPLR